MGDESLRRRERLEDELMGRLKAAERAYRLAQSEHAALRAEFGDMLDTPDGSHAVHQAAKRERIALQHYRRELKVFTELVIEDRCPKAGEER